MGKEINIKYNTVKGEGYDNGREENIDNAYAFGIEAVDCKGRIEFRRSAASFEAWDNHNRTGYHKRICSRGDSGCVARYGNSDGR